MYLTENILRAHADLRTQIHPYVVAFVKTKVPGWNEYDDPYTFDNEGILVKHSYNTACHCHPEIRTDEHRFNLNEFVEWFEKNNWE